ncbi:MAG: hypothetical protein ABIJ97_16115, partial [Bacteroidota bacterium]
MTKLFYTRLFICKCGSNIKHHPITLEGVMKAKVKIFIPNYCVSLIVSVLLILILAQLAYSESNDPNTLLEDVTLGSERGTDFLPERNNIGDNVSTYTGQFMQQLPIASLTGHNGASISFSIGYSSSESYKKMYLNNDMYQASWVGLGWQGGFGYITNDRNGTYDHKDDRYTLLDISGSSYELIPIDGTDNFTFTFRKNWIVTRHVSNGEVVYWTITKDDGKIYTYGNADSSATRYNLRLGEVVGDLLGDTDDYSLNPYQWDLYSITDPSGNNGFYFSYQQQRESLVNDYGSSDSTYTRASHLKRITAPDGKYIEFILEDRLDYSDKWASWHHDYYTTKRLDSVKLMNAEDEILARTAFEYCYLDSSASADQKKLFLKSVKSVSPVDTTTLPAYQFEYEDDPEEEHWGALTKIVEPSGLIQELSYTTVSEANNKTLLEKQFHIREFAHYDAIDKIGVFVDRKVDGANKAAMDYEENLIINTWDGQWKTQIRELNNMDGYLVSGAGDDYITYIRPRDLDSAGDRDSLYITEYKDGRLYDYATPSLVGPWIQKIVSYPPPLNYVDTILLYNSSYYFINGQDIFYIVDPPDSVAIPYAETYAKYDYDVYSYIRYTNDDTTFWTGTKVFGSILGDPNYSFSDAFVYDFDGKSSIFSYGCNDRSNVLISSWVINQSGMYTAISTTDAMENFGPDSVYFGASIKLPYAAFLKKDTNDSLDLYIYKLYGDSIWGQHQIVTDFNANKSGYLKNSLEIGENCMTFVADSIIYVFRNDGTYSSEWSLSDSINTKDVVEQVYYNSHSIVAYLGDSTIVYSWNGTNWGTNILYHSGYSLSLDTAKTDHGVDGLLVNEYSLGGLFWKNNSDPDSVKPMYSFYNKTNNSWSNLTELSPIVNYHEALCFKITDYNMLFFSPDSIPGQYTFKVFEKHNNSLLETNLSIPYLVDSVHSIGDTYFGLSTNNLFYAVERGIPIIDSVQHIEMIISPDSLFPDTTYDTSYSITWETIYSSIDTTTFGSHHFYNSQIEGYADQIMVSQTKISKYNGDTNPIYYDYEYQDVIKDRTDNYAKSYCTRIISPHFSGDTTDTAIYYHYNDLDSANEYPDLGDANKFGIEGGGYLLDGTVFKVQYQNKNGAFTTDYDTSSYKIEELDDGTYRIYIDYNKSSRDGITTETNYRYVNDEYHQIRAVEKSYDGISYNIIDSIIYAYESDTVMENDNVLNLQSELLKVENPDTGTDSLHNKTTFEYSFNSDWRLDKKTTYIFDPSFTDSISSNVILRDRFNNIFEVENAVGLKTGFIYNNDSTK